MRVDVVKTKDIVLEMLERFPHTRKNDEALTANIWYRELHSKGMDPSNITAYKFLEILSKKGLSNAESIRRTRQKIQQKNPHLRGSTYKARQINQERIKEQLK